MQVPFLASSTSYPFHPTLRSLVALNLKLFNILVSAPLSLDLTLLAVQAPALSQFSAAPPASTCSPHSFKPAFNPRSHRRGGKARTERRALRGEERKLLFCFFILLLTPSYPQNGPGHPRCVYSGSSPAGNGDSRKSSICHYGGC